MLKRKPGYIFRQAKITLISHVDQLSMIICMPLLETILTTTATRAPRLPAQSALY